MNIDNMYRTVTYLIELMMIGKPKIPKILAILAIMRSARVSGLERS